MKSRKLIRPAVLAVLTALVIGCGAPVSTEVAPTDTAIPPTATMMAPTPTLEPTPTATELAPTRTPIPSMATKVDVGGFKLFIKCLGEGSPTVVLDACYTCPSLMVWSKLISQNPSNLGVRVCFYDRPSLFEGMGMSDTAPYQPRTNGNMADDLHALLTNGQIPGPYILVAWDMSAYTARIYADRYADEVAGMVLINPMCVGEVEQILAALPPASADEPAALTNFRDWYARILNEPLKITEYWDYRASEEQVRAAGTLGSMPLVILSNDLVRNDLEDPVTYLFGAGFPADVIEALETDKAVREAELLTLSTAATRITVAGIAYDSPVRKPESVAEAIWMVLEEVKQ